MKRIIIILLILNLGIIQTFAKCKSSNIKVFPKTGEISLNSIFIVEGYGTSQNVIQGLNSKYRIYLKSDNSVISLQIIKSYKGQYGITQAILKPIGKLVENKTYTLYIDSLDQYEKEDFYRNDFKWTVNNNIDNDIPLWTLKPQYKSKQKIEYGCGPATFVDFCVCINDISPVLVFTRLKELKTGKISEYFVTPDSTSLRIGHEMCYGEFDFLDGEKYEVSFSLMDASGNKNDTLTSIIKFISPTDEDQENKIEKISCECPKAKEAKMFSINFFIVITILTLILFTIFSRGQKAAAKKRDASNL